jgi:DNA-binding CsgD family transcriptional regulator
MRLAAPPSLPAPPPPVPDPISAALRLIQGRGRALYLQLGRTELGPSIIATHSLGPSAGGCDPAALTGARLIDLGWKPSTLLPCDAPACRSVPGIDHRPTAVWGGLIGDDEQIFGWLGHVGSLPSGGAGAWASARAALVALEREALRVPAEASSLLVAPGGAVVLNSGPADQWLQVPAVAAALPLLQSAASPVLGLRVLRVDCRAQTMEGAAGPHTLLGLRSIRPLQAPPIARLSAVQATVADYAASGATVVEIAAALQRSPETVRTHIKRIYKLLDVASRLELAEALGQDWP